jgi:FAD:protein FMN transferase
MAWMRRVEPIMGTVVDIDANSLSLGADQIDKAVSCVIARLHEIETVFSTYNPESEISRLGRGEVAISETSEEVRHILDLSDKVYAASNGAFDIHAAAACGPAVEHQRSSLSSARPLDPSGVVKGWAIEQAVAVLREQDINNFCINLGGDIYAAGRRSDEEPWRIGLQHPIDKTKVMAVLELCDSAVATSGTYERGAHIVGLDGSEPHGLVSITLIGADIALADAYATAAFAIGTDGIEWARGLSGFEVFAVDDAGMTHYSPSLRECMV